MDSFTLRLLHFGTDRIGRYVDPRSDLDAVTKLTNLFTSTSQQNVTVELVALLLRIQEVLDSNPGPETGILHWNVSWFSAVSACRGGLVPQIILTSLPHSL
jgi:hypothetical protein